MPCEAFLSEERLIALGECLDELLLEIQIARVRRCDSFLVQTPRPLDLRLEPLQEIAPLAAGPHGAVVVHLDLRHEQARITPRTEGVVVGCAAAAALRSAANRFQRLRGANRSQISETRRRVASEYPNRVAPGRERLPVSSLVCIEDGDGLSAQYEWHGNRPSSGANPGKGWRSPTVRSIDRLGLPAPQHVGKEAGFVPLTADLARMNRGDPVDGPLLQCRAVDDEEGRAWRFERRAFHDRREGRRQRRRFVNRAQRVEQPGGRSRRGRDEWYGGSGCHCAIGIQCGASIGDLAVGTGTYFFHLRPRGAEVPLTALEFLAYALKIRARCREFVLRTLTFFLYALYLFLTVLKRCLNALEFIMGVLPPFLCTPQLLLTTLKRRPGTLEFVERLLPFCLGALELFVAALEGYLRTLESVVRANKIFLGARQVRLRGYGVRLYTLELGLDLRNLAVSPLQLPLHTFAIRLCALPIGLSPFHVRVRAFEVCLRPFAFSLRALEICLCPRPLGGDRFVQLTARLKRQFGGRLLGFLPDAQGLRDHRPLDFRAGRRDFGLEARGPLPTGLLELRRPTLFGLSLSVPPRFHHCLFVGPGKPPQMGLELGVQTGSNVVDDGTKRILGHSLALSGGGSGKSSSENAASPRTPAT